MNALPALTVEQEADFLERRARETARDLVDMIGYDQAASQVQTATDAFALEGDKKRVLFCISVSRIINLLRLQYRPDACRRSQSHQYFG